MPLPPPLLALPFSASRSGAAAPDTRDLNIVVVGSSLAADWPAWMSSALTAGGKTNTVTNNGHGSYTIKHAGGSGKLIDLVATEVDALHNPAQANVLYLEGTTNDLYFGATGAQAYQYVKDYLDALATRWDYVVFCTPTPRNNVGTPVGFETERQALLTAVAGDPTFGGRVDAIVDFGNETRMSSTADAYWYNADMVHYTAYAKGLLASAVLTAIRSLLPAVSYSVAHAPYPCPWLTASSGLLNGSAAAPANGDGIASWTPKLAIETTGAYAQGTAGNRPTYDAANTALDVAADDRLVSASAFGTTTRYTLAFRAKLTAAGLFSLHNATSDVRLYTSEGAGTYSLYSYDGGTGSLRESPASTFNDSAWHTFVAVCDGTHAGHKLYVDGSEVTLGTYSTFNGNPSAIGSAVHYLFGSSGSDGVTGKIKAVFKSPVPVNATERAALDAALSAL